MYDTGKIITGLLVFIALVTFPAWYNQAVAKSVAKPELEYPKDTKCVEPKAQMKALHMDMLNKWRDEVVRNGERTYVAADGTKYEKSLSKTCVSCHTKATFCDRCHDYTGVNPYCWSCHIDPKEKK